VLTLKTCLAYEFIYLARLNLFLDFTIWFLYEQQDKGRPLPKFGEWDVNDPASAEGFTVIFNKARDEKKTGGKPGSPGKSSEGHVKSGGGDPSKPQPVSFLFFIFISLIHCHTKWGFIFGFRKNGSAACKLQLWTLDRHKDGFACC